MYFNIDYYYICYRISIYVVIRSFCYKRTLFLLYSFFIYIIYYLCSAVLAYTYVMCIFVIGCLYMEK